MASGVGKVNKLGNTSTRGKKMKKVEGVIIDGMRYYYLDRQGKDIGMKRWRVSAYYTPNFAETFFFDSQEDYNKFLEENESHCYQDFEQFCKDYKARKETAS
ncbi:MAG TPA: hypothetical protein P5244_14885 [Syntrophales bacterium]|nr:hypothetical protein [Syntrophales bacterium]